MRVDQCHITQHAAFHELRDMSVERVRAPLQSSLEDLLARRERSCGNLTSVLIRGGEWRLAVHMLPRLQRGTRQFSMRRGRRRDDDRVDIGAVEHVPIVGDARGLRRARCRAPQKGLVRITDRHDVRGRHAAECCQQLPAPRTDADDAEPHRRARRRQVRRGLCRGKTPFAQEQGERARGPAQEVPTIDDRLHAILTAPDAPDAS